MAEVYVQLSGDAVDSTRCVDGCVDINLDLNGAGEVVGVEVLGAVAVEVDGKRVQDADEGGQERSDPEKLIKSVAERLRDFRFEVGPITWSLLSAGQNRVHLTPEERHQIARAAVQALLEAR